MYVSKLSIGLGWGPPNKILLWNPILSGVAIASHEQGCFQNSLSPDTSSYEGERSKALFWGCPWVSGEKCLKHLPRKESRGPIQMQEPLQLAHLDVEEQQLYSKPLLSGRAPHPIYLGNTAPPCGGNSFWHVLSYFCIRHLVLLVMNQSS